MKNSPLTVLLLAGCLLASACSQQPAGDDARPAGSPAAAQSGAGPAKSDVEFAREAFIRLSSGDEAAEGMIDWENLVAIGEDYGAEYRKLPEQDRAAERKDFIKGFSESFKESGGDPDKIGNWREESKEGDETVVVAELPNGAELLLIVTHRDGQQKLSELGARQRK